MLSQSIANRIIENIKKTINFNINIMDDKATIIGSTDPNRIGLYHEGASIVIETNESIEIFSDDPEKNIKEGINLPIEVNGMVIGVIGLTGNINQVRQYGLIIKEMTQTLVLNTLYVENNLLEIEREYAIIDYIINNRNPVNFTEAEKNNIDSIIKSKFRVVVLKVHRYDDDTYSVHNRIYYYNVIRDYFEKNQCLVGVTNNRIYLIVSDEISESRLNILAGIRELKSTKMGIGQLISSLESIKDSYNVAQYLVESNLGVQSYKDIEDQYIIATINPSASDLFINKIFNQITQDEIIEIIQLVEVYIKFNGSILEASEALFIHKNTLQYRLNRITKITGYNPRNLKDLTILHLGIKLYRRKNPHLL